jgi:hypothetical protein
MVLIMMKQYLLLLNTDVEQSSAKGVNPERLVADDRKTGNREGHGRVALCDDEGALSRVLTS